MSADKEFESELDDYIADRREADRRARRGFFSWLFSSWERRDARDDRSEEEVEMEHIEDDIEVIDEEERELEEMREGLLTRFFKLLRSDTADERGDDDVEESFDEEPAVVEPVEGVDREKVKEVVKIQHKWIEELPARDLSRFKRHEDYDRYRSLLDDLDLIE